MKKRLIFIIGAIIILVIGFLVWYSATFVHFKDKNMGKLLTYEAGKTNMYFVTQKDLDKIEVLTIGPTCHYKTIVDVANCRNLNQLIINTYNLSFTVYKAGLIFGEWDNGNELVAFDEDEEKINRMQNDLCVIFSKCNNIKEFDVLNMVKGTEDLIGYDENHKMYMQFTDISFLEYGEGLECVWLDSQNNISDYSVLKKLKNLRKVLLIDNAGFNSIEDLPIDQLEFYNITNTPAYEEMMKEENQ